MPMRKSILKYIVFIIYVLIVLKLTIFRETTLEQRAINLTLFTDLVNVYKTGTTWQFVRLFFGNILWFVPWGFMIPIMKKSDLGFAVTTGFLFSFTIELLQYFFKKGLFEIDDLILNTAGVLLGYLLYLFVMNLIKNRRKG